MLKNLNKRELINLFTEFYHPRHINGKGQYQGQGMPVSEWKSGKSFFKKSLLEPKSAQCLQVLLDRIPEPVDIEKFLDCHR